MGPFEDIMDQNEEDDLEKAPLAVMHPLHTAASGYIDYSEEKPRGNMYWGVLAAGLGFFPLYFIGLIFGFWNFSWGIYLLGIPFCGVHIVGAIFGLQGDKRGERKAGVANAIVVGVWLSILIIVGVANAL